MVRRPAMDLGGPKARPAAELLDELPFYSNRAELQVDVTGTERSQLRPMEACEGAEEHQSAVALIDRDGQARGQAR